MILTKIDEGVLFFYCSNASLLRYFALFHVMFCYVALNIGKCYNLFVTKITISDEINNKKSMIKSLVFPNDFHCQYILVK